MFPEDRMWMKLLMSFQSGKEQQQKKNNNQFMDLKNIITLYGILKYFCMYYLMKSFQRACEVSWNSVSCKFHMLGN